MSGKLNITEETLPVLQYRDTDFELSVQRTDGTEVDINSCAIGEIVSITFKPPREIDCFFAKDMEDLLECHGFISEPSKCFYVSDIDEYCENKVTSSPILLRYFYAINLYGFLSRLSDHTQKDLHEKPHLIVITLSGKIDIEIQYTSKDLKNLSADSNIDSLSVIENEILSPPHKGTKSSLFKKAISKQLKPVDEARHFATIMLFLNKIIKEYRNNYELFLNEFSFESEKDKLEKEKREYILKLNEVISGIHTKLLSIPAALILSAGQMKTPSDPNHALTNSVIFLGAFVFLIIMAVITHNLLTSLNAIKAEYIEKKARLANDLRESLYPDMKAVFDSLDKRCLHQRNIIRLIDYVTITSFVFIFCIWDHQTYNWFF